MTTFPEALAAELGHYIPGATAEDWEREAAAILARVTDPRAEIEALQLAQLFHETYERLAPEFGYRTREASAVPWDEVPENNRRLMVATCTAILARPAPPSEGLDELRGALRVALTRLNSYIAGDESTEADRSEDSEFIAEARLLVVATSNIGSVPSPQPTRAPQRKPHMSADPRAEIEALRVPADPSAERGES